MVEMYIKADKDSDWEFVGKTEEQKNNYSPKFETKIECRYTFEVKQYCKFVVYDVDGDNLQQVGFYECRLGKIVGSLRSHLIDAQLKSEDEEKQLGFISVLAETVKGRKNDKLRLVLKGTKLLNKDGMFGKSDPFVKIRAIRGNGEIEDVPGNETPHIDNEENPTWEELHLDMFELCRGDVHKPVRLECWDHDGVSGNDQIGLVDTTVAEILSGVPLVMIDYQVPPRPDKVPGTLQYVSGAIERVPTFFDYIKGDLELTTTVAIDFTSSNKPSDQEDSLHYLGGEPNQYQQAITEVCGILEEYDSDKKFECYGYGAICENLGKEEAEFSFPLTFDEENPAVEGVEGVLAVYAEAAATVKYYGPTNFAEVIEKAIARANDKSESHYEVLLILTGVSRVTWSFVGGWV